MNLFLKFLLLAFIMHLLAGLHLSRTISTKHFYFFFDLSIFHVLLISFLRRQYRTDEFLRIVNKMKH